MYVERSLLELCLNPFSRSTPTVPNRRSQAVDVIVDVIAYTRIASKIIDSVGFHFSLGQRYL